MNRRWSAKEERRLFKLRADGKSIADIAKRLKRTEAAVSVRISLLRRHGLKKSLRAVCGQASVGSGHPAKRNQ